MNEIQFIASIPPIATAISLDGQGDGGKLKLDIPQSHLESVLELHHLNETNLVVNISAGSDKEPREIMFEASLPPISSAITLDGRGEGARIKLDIPRVYVDKLVMLFALTETVLSVKIKSQE